MADALCVTRGTKIRPAGGCDVCTRCGSTSGYRIAGGDDVRPAQS
jgi:hypothetical protein